VAEREAVVACRPSPALTAAIYGNAFAIGAVLMGFEMLGSRYIYPYFGGGIGTWAALISVVLLSLAIGYFTGGYLTQRTGALRKVAILFAVAAGYLALVPHFADPVMNSILDALASGVLAQFCAATALTLVPLSLLATLSPVAVSVLAAGGSGSGAVAGWVYGISTIGNILGVLVTTFLLVPLVGSRAITYGFAIVVALCAVMLALSQRRTAV
jgi:MFS family permease